MTSSVLERPCQATTSITPRSPQMENESSGTNAQPRESSRRAIASWSAAWPAPMTRSMSAPRQRTTRSTSASRARATASMAAIERSSTRPRSTRATTHRDTPARMATSCWRMFRCNRMPRSWRPTRSQFMRPCWRLALIAGVSLASRSIQAAGRERSPHLSSSKCTACTLRSMTGDRWPRDRRSRPRPERGPDGRPPGKAAVQAVTGPRTCDKVHCVHLVEGIEVRAAPEAAPSGIGARRQRQRRAGSGRSATASAERERGAAPQGAPSGIGARRHSERRAGSGRSATASAERERGAAPQGAPSGIGARRHRERRAGSGRSATASAER